MNRRHTAELERETACFASKQEDNTRAEILLTRAFSPARRNKLRQNQYSRSGLQVV